MRPAPASPVRAVPLFAAAFALATNLAIASSASAANAAGPRAALLTVPADLPAELLGESLSATVTVRALVAPSGLVDSTRAEAGDGRLRASAEAAVRWWVFAPGKDREWVAVSVPFEVTSDAEPLHPDVLAIARQAEADGDLTLALTGWVGALQRLGSSPVANNEWSLREHAVAVAARMPSPPPIGDELATIGHTSRVEQLRTVARSDHLELVRRFDRVLAGAPWWPEPYLWRAGSLAGCGHTAEALRSLRFYRVATRDSAGARFAERLIDRLAASDTTGASAAVRTWGVTVGPDDR